MMWSQLPAEYKKQLENWVHWTRRDLGQPEGYKSNMPEYASRKDGDDTMPVDPIIYVFNQDAERFDALVKGLAKDKLHIFKIHYITHTIWNSWVSNPSMIIYIISNQSGRVK